MSKQNYVWQTYKEKRKIYPYEETTAYYFGPKLDFTKKIKDNSRKKTYGTVQKNSTRQ